MRFRIIALAVIILLPLLLLVPSLACAQSLAISPGSLSFSLYRGEESNSALRIFNPSASALNYHLSAEDCSPWFSFSEPDGIISPGGYRDIRITVSPEPDAANGLYDCLMAVATYSSETPGSVNLALATGIKARVEISGSQTLSLAVGKVSAAPAEPGIPLVISIELANNGNVRLRPSAQVILRKNGRVLSQSSYPLGEILPSVETIAQANIPTAGLEPGSYDANVAVIDNSVPYAIASLPVAILPYGTLTRKGELLDLRIVGEPVLGGTIKVVARFANSGAINLPARLKTEVYRSGNLESVAYGDETLVRPGEIAELEAYVNFSGSGQYTLTSAVVFSGDKTASGSQVIDVALSRQAEPQGPLGIMISCSIAGVGMAIYFRKEVKQMVKNAVKEKIYYCIDCNRPISHKGRCMPCNLRAKTHREAQEKKYQ